MWPFPVVSSANTTSPTLMTRFSPSLAVSSYSASSQITYCRHGVGCGDWRTLTFVFVPSTKRMAAAGSRLDNLRPQGVSSVHSISISRKCDSPSASANKLRIRIVHSPRRWPSIGLVFPQSLPRPGALRDGLSVSLGPSKGPFITEVGPRVRILFPPAANRSPMGRDGGSGRDPSVDRQHISASSKPGRSVSDQNGAAHLWYDLGQRQPYIVELSVVPLSAPTVSLVLAA